MFGRLFRRETGADAIASILYGAIVAQARNPVLYADFGVPDTVSGRFEMVVLHTGLVLDRLQREGEAGKAAGQKVFDLYCRDMDQSLRELGIGDLGVPKRMKKMAEAFYGRAAVYGAAVAAKDKVLLAEALTRNAFAGGKSAGGEIPLADYVLASAERLNAVSLLEEPLAFANPAAFVSAGEAA
jgi:cytochrome b pre-mRNA-processing protein 3